jgi:hypothetical protein
MNGKIVWLASYPKSGNTWMRILLTNFLRDTDTPADINFLETGKIASGRQIFDDNVGVEASDLTQGEIERYRPYVYEQISKRADSPLFIKVHDAYSMTVDGIPLLAPQATAGIIYLVRNPLDVCVSFAHHSGIDTGTCAENMNDENFAFVNQSDRLHNQLLQKICSWSGHVKSYLDQPKLPLLLIRYEDMLEDTEKQLAKTVEFAEFEPDPARVRRAVEFSTFATLKAQEQEHGFQEKMPKAESFFREGKSGNWRTALSTELAQSILDHHGETMTRLGYSTNI